MGSSGNDSFYGNAGNDTLDGGTGTDAAAYTGNPDASGLGRNIDLVDGGMTMAQMLAAFVASAEFTSTYGALTNTQFLDQLYLNVLGRPADAAGAA